MAGAGPRVSREHTVTQADTAQQVGSGELAVLATPRLVQWLEQTTFHAARQITEPGATSVGTHVRVEHLKATLVGAIVTCECDEPMVDGRRLVYPVRALDDSGVVVATGEIHRHIVDTTRFLERLG